MGWSETCSGGGESITCYGEDSYGCVCVEQTDGSWSCDCVWRKVRTQKDARLKLALDSRVTLNVKQIPRTALCAFLDANSAVSVEAPLKEAANELVDASFKAKPFSDILRALNIAFK